MATTSKGKTRHDWYRDHHDVMSIQYSDGIIDQSKDDLNEGPAPVAVPESTIAAVVSVTIVIAQVGMTGMTDMDDLYYKDQEEMDMVILEFILHVSQMWHQILEEAEHQPDLVMECKARLIPLVLVAFNIMQKKCDK